MICKTNFMQQFWFINQPLAQHVSGTIMPIFKSASPYITAYGFQHLMCWKPYAVIYGLALLKMGIMVPETCWANGWLLTYSTVQSAFWEVNWFAASQEIPRISRNPKVHYRTHKRPPPVSILDQPNPVHIPISHLLEIRLNIVHPSTPRSPQWSSSLRFPHQDPIHLPLLTHTCHMPSPSHSSRFYHQHNIGWGVQVI